MGIYVETSVWLNESVYNGHMNIIQQFKSWRRRRAAMKDLKTELFSNIREVKELERRLIQSCNYDGKNEIYRHRPVSGGLDGHFFSDYLGLMGQNQSILKYWLFLESIQDNKEYLK